MMNTRSIQLTDAVLGNFDTLDAVLCAIEFPEDDRENGSPQRADNRSRADNSTLSLRSRNWERRIPWLGL